jgi:hypothetical protein
MALLTACVGVRGRIQHSFVDYAELMPDLDCIVTIKEVQQTSSIVKSLNGEWSLINLVTKVSEYIVIFLCLAYSLTES